MAVLDILIYPDPRLRQKARPVAEFNDELKKLVADMAQTMYSAKGIGLAAVQVNVAKRVVVIDLSQQRNELKVFINPQVIPIEGVVESEEGCLSVPGFSAPIQRVQTVAIKAQDIDGQPFEVMADELLSVCIQHEVDHLDGKVFVDYLSRIKQDRVRKKIKKETRQTEHQAA